MITLMNTDRDIMELSEQHRDLWDLSGDMKTNCSFRSRLIGKFVLLQNPFWSCMKHFH